MATDARVNRAAAVIERALIAAGIACLAGYGWLSYRSGQLEAESRRAALQMLATTEDVSTPAVVPATFTSSSPSGAGVIGEISIPRLDLSAALVNGDDERALAGAVGHLRNTVMPWERGNTAFAGHRDRLFRPLARIHIGDAISLSTRHGRFDYRVVRTFVVAPRDVWVLDDSPGVDLTLVTCYPFVFAGHAPQRFIVRARRVAAH